MNPINRMACGLFPGLNIRIVRKSFSRAVRMPGRTTAIRGWWPPTKHDQDMQVHEDHATGEAGDTLGDPGFRAGLGFLALAALFQNLDVSIEDG